jgi:hypothetical protein
MQIETVCSNSLCPILDFWWKIWKKVAARLFEFKVHIPQISETYLSRLFKYCYDLVSVKRNNGPFTEHEN